MQNYPAWPSRNASLANTMFTCSPGESELQNILQIRGSPDPAPASSPVHQQLLTQHKLFSLIQGTLTFKGKRTFSGLRQPYSLQALVAKTRPTEHRPSAPRAQLRALKHAPGTGWSMCTWHLPISPPVTESSFPPDWLGLELLGINPAKLQFLPGLKSASREQSCQCGHKLERGHEVCPG